MCPSVPEMHDWERHEALGGDRYGYYEDFDGRSGSSDYDDPRDYREWCDWSDIEDDEGYCDPFLEETGDDYVVINCDSGMAVDDTVIAAIASSDSDPVPGGPSPGGLLHLPWTHPGLDLSVRELEDMMCLLDHSAEHENYFPRPGSGLVNPVLLVNCASDLGGCLREPGALPDVPGCVVDCGPGPEVLPLGDNGVLSECDDRIKVIIHVGLPSRHDTWRKLSDNSGDPEGWSVLNGPGLTNDGHWDPDESIPDLGRVLRLPKRCNITDLGPVMVSPTAEMCVYISDSFLCCVGLAGPTFGVRIVGNKQYDQGSAIDLWTIIMFVRLGCYSGTIG